MPRKTRLDSKPRRRRNERGAVVCEMEQEEVANPRFLSEKTEQIVAAAIFEVAANPEKYKHLQE